MLIDEVIIKVKAGDGGNGAVSFRREKYVPKGGPDGGDGGKGGSVCIVASPSTHGLGQFRGQKEFKAENGQGGGKARRHGKNGDDLILTVPPGTLVTELLPDGSERLVSDLATSDQQIAVARGGRGGRGNWHFRSATNQTPLEFEAGTKGREFTLKLELRLIADVGLIGLPNAGKSTLLSVISNAKPKIADYPFTTLEPNLGTVQYHDRQFVAADIPGLIEGAAGGKGLGHEFLRHVQRTQLLVHLVPITEDDLEKAYQTVRQELKGFDPQLAKRPEIVVVTKIDIDPEWRKKAATFIKKHRAMGLSAATHAGVNELLAAIAARLG